AVRTPAPRELLERRHLGWVDGDDQLPAAFVTNRVFLTEAKQRARPAHAQARLERTRRVIDPAVDNARVVGRLVPRDAVLSFDDGEAHVGTPPQELACDREPEDAGADDVALLRGWGGLHGRPIPSARVDRLGSRVHR